MKSRSRPICTQLQNGTSFDPDEVTEIMFSSTMNSDHSNKNHIADTGVAYVRGLLYYYEKPVDFLPRSQGSPTV